MSIDMQEHTVQIRASQSTLRVMRQRSPNRPYVRMKRSSQEQQDHPRKATANTPTANAAKLPVCTAAPLWCVVAAAVAEVVVLLDDTALKLSVVATIPVALAPPVVVFVIVIVLVMLVVALGVPVSVDDSEVAGMVLFRAIVDDSVAVGAMEEGPTPPEREKRPE